MYTSVFNFTFVNDKKKPVLSPASYMLPMKAGQYKCKKMKDRIRQLMESQHLSQQQFADMLNISPASLSSIFNDRTKPTLNHVDAIQRSFPDINLRWLLYGEGQMFDSNNENSSSSKDTPQSSTSKPSASGGDLVLDFGPITPTPQQQRASSAFPQTGAKSDNMHDSASWKNVDTRPRKIAEIRIFYDDQTWETFIPKK